MHRPPIGALAAAADDEFGGVADPPLIQSRRGELARQHIGGDRLIVFAHRRRAKALPRSGAQALGSHQPRDALLADALALLAQVF